MCGTKQAYPFTYKGFESMTRPPCRIICTAPDHRTIYRKFCVEDARSLAKELKAHLPWYQARIIFCAQFILTLIRERSTNLYRVAEELQRRSPSKSSYRRIKRFFSGYTYCYEQLARLILHCLNLTSFTLCMDRTKQP